MCVVSSEVYRLGCAHASFPTFPYTLDGNLEISTFSPSIPAVICLCHCGAGLLGQDKHSWYSHCLTLWPAVQNFIRGKLVRSDLSWRFADIVFYLHCVFEGWSSLCFSLVYVVCGLLIRGGHQICDIAGSISFLWDLWVTFCWIGTCTSLFALFLTVASLHPIKRIRICKMFIEYLPNSWYWMNHYGGHTDGSNELCPPIA